MSSSATCRETLKRYLIARIPFISIRTTERMRALEILKGLASELTTTPTYVHTLSLGLRDIITDRMVAEERTVYGALDRISKEVASRQNLTYILTEAPDLTDENDLTRQIQDIVTLALDRGGSIIVITSNPVWGQLQRMGMSITLDPPNEDEMYTIIKSQIDPYQGQLVIEWEEKELREAAAILAGITQVEAENVIATLLANRAIIKADLNELRHAKDRIFSDISGLERIPMRGYDPAVGGLAGLRKWLDRQRPLLTAADLKDRNLRPPRGVLLVGVPGCGKSLSAKAIAASWNLPLYRLDLSTIHGQYLGQSEGRLKDALATADHIAPCVLWIDEIEKGLAGAIAGAGDGGTSTRLVGQFLFWLQEARARVFVVATANDVSKLPPELLRRGRFDEMFFVDLPSEEERKEIIQIYARRNLKRPVNDALLSDLVSLSEGFAGSDIEAAVRDVGVEAYLRGDDAVTDDLFRRSFENVVPLIKTNPEGVKSIQEWGRDRAVPASGNPIGGSADKPKPRRGVLFDA